MIWQIAHRNSHPETIRRSIEWGAATVKAGWRKYWRIKRQLAQMRLDWQEQRALDPYQLVEAHMVDKAERITGSLRAFTHRSGDILAHAPKLSVYAENLRRQDLPLTIWGTRTHRIATNLP